MASVWDPTSDSKVTKVVELDCSRDDDGKARASVTLRRWSGRERLAYEDALFSRMLTEAADGSDMLLLGSLKSYGAALTIVDSTGFAPADDDRPFLTGTAQQREDDLLTLNVDVMDEIRAAALDFQPLPRGEVDEVEETPADSEADLPDPSPTPPTPPAAIETEENPFD